MAGSKVLYDVRDGVALVTLNSAGEANVIDSELAQELLDVCRRINENDEIHVVILTGAGGTFSSGSRLEQMVSTGTAVRKAVSTLGDDAVRYEVASAIALIDRPVIAAINGDAMGQGLELVLACDVRIAVEDARFGFPHVASGLMPMDGGTQRLPRLIGKGKALELILGGEAIDAREAVAAGLISQSGGSRRVDGGGDGDGAGHGHQGADCPTLCQRSGEQRHGLDFGSGGPARGRPLFPDSHHRGPDRRYPGFPGKEKAGVQGNVMGFGGRRWVHWS